MFLEPVLMKRQISFGINFDNLIFMNKLILNFFFTFSLFGYSIAQEINTIEGVAPGFVGKSIEFIQYEDFLSYNEISLGKTKVKEDSTFSISIFNDTIKKIAVRIDNSFFETYIEPGNEYEFYIDGDYERDFKNKGRNLDLDFYYLKLDSSDINFKILEFDKNLYSFLQGNFTHKKRSSGDFAASIEEFKNKISSNIEESDSSFYRVYVTFAIAQIDNLPFNGNRNRYEKYDFYIKPETVWYYNDRYMDYINHYYKGYINQLPKKLNDKFYSAIIESSPTKLMNVLGKDYALDNVKLREYVLIKMLSELYYDEEFPETNIREVLDSLSNNALFSQNKKIASNIYGRLTDLAPGGKLPDFIIKEGGEVVYSKSDLNGKHTYLHFLSMNDKTSISDLNLLRHLHDKYYEDINFVSFIAVDEENRAKAKELLEGKTLKDNWKVFFIDPSHSIFEKFKINNFPFYILTDVDANIVSAPALTPRPNNEYETIERVFFNIQKVRKRNEK